MQAPMLAFALSLTMLAPALAASDILVLDDSVVREWHGLGWDCLPENNPPEGWLRKGGYCELVRTKDSLTFSGKNLTIVSP